MRRPDFHPTGNLAPFGAATGAAHLLKLDGSQYALAPGLLLKATMRPVTATALVLSFFLLVGQIAQKDEHAIH